MLKFLPLLAVTVFLALAVPNLHCPGLHMDEGTYGNIAGYVLGPASSQHSLVLLNYHVKLFGRILPIYAEEYVGAVMHYFLSPALRLFGRNVMAIRLTTIAFSCCSIVFLYFFCESWFNRRVAFLSSLLLASNLLFVQFSRIAFHREEILLITFLSAFAFFAVKYSESGKTRFLCFSSFCLGLGLAAKITFLWYLIGLGIATILLFRNPPLKRSLQFREYILASLAFCLGSLFLILYNVNNDWKTLALFINCLLESVPGHEVNNLQYFSNLAVRWNHLLQFLKGHIMVSDQWGIVSTSPVEALGPYVLWTNIVSIVCLPVLSLFPKGALKRVRGRLLFLYSMYAVGFFLTPFSLKGLCMGHLLVLLPLPQIALALLLDYLWCLAKEKMSLFSPVLLFLLLPVLVFNIGTNAYFSVQMSKNGGRGRWSTAIYELAEYLEENGIDSPVTFGHGLRENIAFLTHFRVNPIVCNGDSPQQLSRTLEKLSSKKGPIYSLWAATDYEDEHRRDRFAGLAFREGKVGKLEKIFFNQAGAPVFWLTGFHSPGKGIK